LRFCCFSVSPFSDEQLDYSSTARRSPKFATQTFRMLCIPIPITREGFW